MTGMAELVAAACAAAAAANKFGGGATGATADATADTGGVAPAAKAANPAAEGPFNKPKLCMAAACKIGGLEAILIFSISASCSRFDLALRF